MDYARTRGRDHPLGETSRKSLDIAPLRTRIATAGPFFQFSRSTSHADPVMSGNSIEYLGAAE